MSAKNPFLGLGFGSPFTTFTTFARASSSSFSGKIIIGAERDNDSGSAAAGSVYIYNLDGTGEVKITAADAGESDIRNDDFFGKAVAIGNNKIVVGARRQRNESNKGAVYVFDIDGSNGFKISPSDGAAGDHFGNSVAVGHDKIVVGSYDHNSDTGAVYVYNLDGTGEVKITASDGATSDKFGFNVAIGHNKIVAGAYQNAAGGNRRGAVYVYNLDGTGELKITASDGTDNDKLGSAVAIGNNKIVAGASEDGPGSVYVYNLDGTGELKITASDAAGGDDFGTQVAIGNNKIGVGAVGDDPGGALYVYDLDGTNEVKITPSDSAAGDGLGYHRYVSIGGNKIAGGAAGDDDDGDGSGSVYVYNLDGTGELKITASDGAAGAKFGSAVAIG